MRWIDVEVYIEDHDDGDRDDDECNSIQFKWFSHWQTLMYTHAFD